ncbi:MAG: hypothetical protein ACP5OP_05670 [Leptospirillia bacterium]
MNRWFFLGGTAVVGLLLYLVFKVSHPGAGDVGREGFVASKGGGEFSGWNDLAAPRLPLPAPPPPALPERSLSGQGGEPERHPLDTKSTVYLDGQGPEGEGGGLAGGAGTPLVLSALKSVLGQAGEPAGLARQAEAIRRSAGGEPPVGVSTRRVAAGSEMAVVAEKTITGPGAQMPVVVRVSGRSLAALHLPPGTKVLGTPESLAGSRLRIRFTRILYPGGLEAHTTGFALSGGREGVPVPVDRHEGGNIGRSVAQNSMMLGGEAVDTMGWAGNNVGDMMAMQAGGNAMAMAGSQIPTPMNRTTYTLSRGTRFSIMIMESFPVLDGSGEK